MAAHKAKTENVDEELAKPAKSSAKKLVANVFVDGEWYGPDHAAAPADIAAKITNPAAWG